MSSSRRFAATLAGFVLIYGLYGLRRLGLGVDFTDEGAYLAWPLRTLFGEPSFAGDPLLSLRPLLNHLSLIYRIYPEISLYEFRWLGWIAHLGSFSMLALCLFRLSGAAFRSPLIASVPFFACHIFGLAVPSYNSISSDFFLIALSLFGLAAGGKPRHPLALHLAGGLALFIASLAHPVLGVVAALIGLNEIFRRNLLQNLRHLRPAASNAGFLAFAGCWLVYFFYLLATGAFAVWLQRSALYPSARIRSLGQNPSRFFLELLTYPFAYDPVAVGFSVAVLALAVALAMLARAGRTAAAGNTAAALALLLVIAIIRTFSYNPGQLPVAFAMVGIVVVFVHCLRIGEPALAVEPDIRFLLAASTLAGLLYAAVTFYFSPLRSWTSGILALPFAFAVGLSLLLRATADRFAPLIRVLSTATLALAVACVAREHYRSIYRDAAPAGLVATFRAPKLRHIRSTPERTQAIDALYDYLHPQLARGEPLLAFDDCPMLYYLFDAMPAYGLTWAVRYTQSPAALRQLNRELNAKPLPRFAVRTLVDLSHPVWRTAPRTNYANYPLNETVLANYRLEQTIFPFEIWRLNKTGR